MKMMEENLAKTIEAMNDTKIIDKVKEFYVSNDLVWPKDWLDLNIEVANTREQALEELIEMLLDEGVIGVKDQGPYFSAADRYLENNGIDENRWTILLGQTHKEITFFKRLHADGGGFKVHVDKVHAEALDLEYGDYVQITMRRSN